MSLVTPSWNQLKYFPISIQEFWRTAVFQMASGVLSLLSNRLSIYLRSLLHLTLSLDTRTFSWGLDAFCWSRDALWIHSYELPLKSYFRGRLLQVHIFYLGNSISFLYLEWILLIFLIAPKLQSFETLGLVTVLIEFTLWSRWLPWSEFTFR